MVLLAALLVLVFLVSFQIFSPRRFQLHQNQKPRCLRSLLFQPVKVPVLSLLFAEAYQLGCNTHSAEVFINSEFCNPVEFSLQTVRRFFLDYVFNGCKSADCVTVHGNDNIGIFAVKNFVYYVFHLIAEIISEYIRSAV